MSKPIKFEKFQEKLFPLNVKIIYKNMIIYRPYRFDITTFCPPNKTIGISVSEEAYQSTKSKKFLVNSIKKKLACAVQKEVLNNLLNGKNSRTNENIILTTLLKDNEEVTIMHPTLYAKKLKEGFENV